MGISLGELEIFDVIERNKRNQIKNSVPRETNLTNFSPELNGERKKLSIESRSNEYPVSSFEEEKRDYHEKNQLFLQKLAQEQSRQSRTSTLSPPRRDCPRSIFLSHPPTTGHSHRRLESIGNDDWEDSGAESINDNDA